jgi:geranylgeranyl diphosphate synthase, type I
LVDDKVGQPYAAARAMTGPGAKLNRARVDDVARSSGTSGTSGEFDGFVRSVREQVERHLERWLADRLDEAKRRGPDVEAVASAVGQLTMRGGKRMRAVLLAIAFEGCGGQGSTAVVAPAGASLELLQTYLLVHDDWMDGDDIRRGGPSVPALMRQRFSRDRADAMSILAGDLAAGWARRALFDAAAAPERLVAAARELARVEEDVVEGQILDVGARAADAAAVEAVHMLKTTSYTVRGPVVMGAHLAGAGALQVAGLTAFAEPLGVAFQLRDDVLGVFGDEAKTGKPAGNDLRAGKRSAVAVAAFQAGLGGPFERVFGHAGASDGDVRAAVEQLDAEGVRARVEERIEALVRQSCAALDHLELTATGRQLFASAVAALTDRQT